MSAANPTPREEDEAGSSPTFSHSYRITVEEADGRTHAHDFSAATKQLALGDVIELGQDGWDGPRVAIEEIDRHPNTNHPGAALAWPLVSRLPMPAKG